MRFAWPIPYGTCGTSRGADNDWFNDCSAATSASMDLVPSESGDLPPLAPAWTDPDRGIRAQARVPFRPIPRARFGLSHTLPCRMGETL